MGNVAARIGISALVCVAVVLALVPVGRWMNANKRGGLQPVEPFRIADNFYYVGTNAVSSFLMTGPEGHVLLADGFPSTAPIIIASIASLGFNIRDVKVLVTSQPGPDHEGVLMPLQQASGATLWANDLGADTLATGGDSPDMALPLRAFIWIGLAGYVPPHVDRRFQDGDTIRVGPLAVTAHLTGGGSRSCTSWSFPVRDGDRVLNVVSACGLSVALGMRYPEQGADIERSLRVLRNLPADIWVTSSARAWGRYRKFAARDIVKNPVDAFIDPEGYRAFLDAAEEEHRNGIVH